MCMPKLARGAHRRATCCTTRRACVSSTGRHRHPCELQEGCLLHSGSEEAKKQADREQEEQDALEREMARQREEGASEVRPRAWRRAARV